MLPNRSGLALLALLTLGAGFAGLGGVGSEATGPKANIDLAAFLRAASWAISDFGSFLVLVMADKTSSFSSSLRKQIFVKYVVKYIIQVLLTR